MRAISRRNKQPSEVQQKNTQTDKTATENKTYRANSHSWSSMSEKKRQVQAKSGNMVGKTKKKKDTIVTVLDNNT